jgi:hypothetical protein
MNRSRLFAAWAVVAVGLAGLIPSGGVRADHAKSTWDWKVLGAGTEVKAGTKYTLFNITEKEAVRYGKRTWGIDLVWDMKTTLNNISFVTKDGKAGTTLKCGDVVAIKVEGSAGYLHYQKRSFGINLEYSKTPVYEFVVLCKNNKGTPIKVNEPIGIYNQVEKDFIIYAERPVGINLRWWSDRDLPGSLLGRLEQIILDLDRHNLEEVAAVFLARKTKNEKK